MENWELNGWHWCLGNGDCWIGWADHWQTMITGVLAVTAAGAAAAVAAEQLRAARTQAAISREQLAAQIADVKDGRDRSFRAARASFPGILSAICNHAEAVFTSLNALWPVEMQLYPYDVMDDPYIDVQAAIPRFPDELISPLREVLHHTDDEPVRFRVASIFREAQVLDARTRPLAQRQRVGLHTVAGYMIESAALYAEAESLFSFARGRSETVSPEALWPRAISFLSLRGVPELVLDMARKERDEGVALGEADTHMEG